MKVLVIGSGGREHAIAWKLAQSAEVQTVYAAPGNGGTAREAKCVNVPCPAPESPEGRARLVAFAKAEGVALTVVGPEAPLAAGLVDEFRAAGLAVLGPDADAARLEASKAFSKDFMAKYGVRAAASVAFDDLRAALAHARAHFARSASQPLVVKADGLAAGKGVVVAETLIQAETALQAFMAERSLGDAGGTVVLEDYLTGLEVSVLAAVCAGPGVAEPRIVPFVSARDHKRRYDGAQGPNTGGMGAIAPVPDFSAAAMADFRASILEPTLEGIAAEGFDYRGFIFFGLMVDGNRCSLLEYNARLGDPETQAVLPLMDSDFLGLCRAIEGGGLDSFRLAWKGGACCAPVAVAEGYPGEYRKGDAVETDGPALRASGAKIFVAGAVLAGEELKTSGGRVLCASAVGATAETARERAYAGLGAVKFAGMGFRKDIGAEKQS